MPEEHQHGQDVNNHSFIEHTKCFLSTLLIILIIKNKFETSPRIKSNDYYLRPFKRIESHVKRGLESYWIEI